MLALTTSTNGRERWSGMAIVKKGRHSAPPVDLGLRPASFLATAVHCLATRGMRLVSLACGSFPDLNHLPTAATATIEDLTRKPTPSPCLGVAFPCQK